MVNKKSWRLIVLLVPVVALADEPLPQAQTLAAVEVVVEHCAKLAPASGDRLRESAKLAALGASEEALDKIRRSDEYRAARDATLEALAKESAQDVKKACEGPLLSNQ